MGSIVSAIVVYLNLMFEWALSAKQQSIARKHQGQSTGDNKRMSDKIESKSQS